MERFEYSPEEIPKLKFVSFGSPLFDIIVDVDDKFVQKYKIRMGQTLQEEVQKLPFYDEIFQLNLLNLTYLPGGCQFNTMRVFNVRIFFYFYFFSGFIIIQQMVIKMKEMKKKTQLA